MEKFKTRSGEVRLASTSGHVVTVSEEFVPVPDELVSQALANRCIPKDLYDQALADAKKEAAGGDGDNANMGGDDVNMISTALARISEELEAGKTETEKGVALETSTGLPTVEAVEEYSGINVTRKMINEVIGE